MNAPTNLLTQVYTFSLKLYPRAFRAEYEEELCAVFSLVIETAAGDGILGLAKVAWRELRDLPFSVVAAYVSERRRIKMQNQMNKTTKQVLFWTPRILCVLFALFLSLFALDVFSGDSGFGEKILGLLIHLVPVYIVVIVLVIAWRWEWIGGILFLGLALFYLFQVWGQEHWSAYLGISGPLTLMGVLFLLNWKYRAQLRARP